MEEKPKLQKLHQQTSNGNNVFLETGRSEKPAFLVKCPPLVSRFLQPSPPDASSSSSDPSFPIAKVVISIDPLASDDDNSLTEYTMELAGPESGNVPKSYSMDIADFLPTSVFSESSQGKLSVEGKILHKFDLKPLAQNMENYGKLCRERTQKYMTKTRQIQVISNDTGANMRPMPGMMGFVVTAQTDKKKTATKGSETKRTRRARGEMEEIMFKLFERQPNWTLRQLIQETNQPEQFLKDLLKDLCVYNNKGPNQGTYELKPEYRKSDEDLTSK
ncbi:hypothetical protein UlMin_025848 [Ulmus minor]